VGWISPQYCRAIRLIATSPLLWGGLHETPAADLDPEVGPVDPGLVARPGRRNRSKSPGHGTLTGSAPDLTYTPEADYAGLDGFTFKISEGQADSAPATVSITVVPNGLIRVFIALIACK
jgi:Bacterial Ig domain